MSLPEEPVEGAHARRLFGDYGNGSKSSKSWGLEERSSEGKGELLYHR